MTNASVKKVLQVPLPDIAVQQSTDAGRKYWLQHIQCWTLFLERNKQYGNSIEETGVLGAVVELVAKNARLRELVLKNQSWGFGMDTPLGGELEQRVKDTLQDLVNYGVIALMMLEDENYRGVENEA